MTSSRADRWVLAAALAGPVLVAAALVPVRDDLVSTNTALLLVVVVVAVAATGHRVAAALAALVAAGAFNFFHTQPYYSLRINSGDDLETAVLLLLVGLAVGEVAARGRRAAEAAAVGRRDLASLHGLGALVAEGEDADYVLLATEAELTQLLALESCHFEVTEQDSAQLPVVNRDGSVGWGPTPWESERWGLPTVGVAIPVWSRGVRLGRFVCTAPVGVPYPSEQLAKAVALVDQAGAALAGRPASR
jgi:K+-sensing histidine kinase KdpD